MLPSTSANCSTAVYHFLDLGTNRALCLETQKVARVYNNLGKGFVLQTFTAREDRKSSAPALHQPQQPKNTESGAEVWRSGRRRLCQDEKAEQSQVAGAGRARACGDVMPPLLVSIPTAHRVHSQQDGTNTPRCNHSTSINTSRVVALP